MNQSTDVWLDTLKSTTINVGFPIFETHVQYREGVPFLTVLVEQLFLSVWGPRGPAQLDEG